MTAMAVVCRIIMDKRRDEKVLGGIERIKADPPAWSPTAVDFMYCFLGSLALYQSGGGDCRTFRAWHGSAVALLEQHQAADGSWEPIDRWSFAGGPVYATAINVLTLLTETRPCPIFVKKPARD